MRRRSSASAHVPGRPRPQRWPTASAARRPPSRAAARRAKLGRERSLRRAGGRRAAPPPRPTPSSARSDDSIRTCSSASSGRAGAVPAECPSAPAGQRRATRGARERSTRRARSSTGMRAASAVGCSTARAISDAIVRRPGSPRRSGTRRRTARGRTGGRQLGLRPELDEDDRDLRPVGGPHERDVLLARVARDDPHGHFGAGHVARARHHDGSRLRADAELLARAARRASR